MTEQITHEMAAQALDSLDDCARMNVSMDAIGPRSVLERYIAQQAASAAPAQEQIESLSRLCAEAYQVVGILAVEAGRFEDDYVIKALDNLSEQKLVHDDVLPFPCATPVASAAPVVPEAARIAELERENALLKQPPPIPGNVFKVSHHPDCTCYHLPSRPQHLGHHPSCRLSIRAKNKKLHAQLVAAKQAKG